MEFDNKTLVYGLFNQYVISSARMNIEYIKMYFYDKYILNNNTLITRLIELIDKYDYNDLTESRFMLTLRSDGKSEDESRSIYNKILEYQRYNKEQAKVFEENLKKLCYTAWENRCQKRYGDNPVAYGEEMKKFKYKSNTSLNFESKKFSQLDITDLVNRYTGKGFKSKYEFINKAFSCGGYIPGQIVEVCAAPGIGKSLFLQGECVNFIKQGKRTHWLCLGDLNELDVSIRMICQMSGRPQREVESDILGFFNKYKDQFADYLELTVVPSGTVTPREYIDWAVNRSDDFDIFFIDYDSNFMQDENLSLYERGGNIYDAITELTRLGKLVFIATQPKQSYFYEEFLPYDAVG